MFKFSVIILFSNALFVPNCSLKFYQIFFHYAHAINHVGQAEHNSPRTQQFNSN